MFRINGQITFTEEEVQPQQIIITPGHTATFVQAPTINTIATPTGSTLAEPILPGSTITGTETNLVVTPPAPVEAAGDIEDTN